MAWDPYQQKKFVSRKNKFALDENFHLDKIRGEHRKKRKLTLNVWTALIISLTILIAAFALPRTAQAVITRSHTDALVDLEKTRSSMVQTEMNSIPDDTIIVIREGSKYYLFWYKAGARGLSKDGEKDNGEYADIVEFSNPGEYRPPINVAKGEKIRYPFTEEPITEKNGKAYTAAGLEVLSGYKLISYAADEELQKLLKKNVSLYSLVPVNGSAPN